MWAIQIVSTLATTVTAIYKTMYGNKYKIHYLIE